MTFLGKNQHQPWTEREENFLIDNYYGNSIETLAKTLTNRTPIAIKAKAGKLKLRNGRKWSDREKRYLNELINEYPLSVIVKKYNIWAQKNSFYSRSNSQIREKIKQQKKSVRLNASSSYLTPYDLSYLLGCNSSTAHAYFRYKDFKTTKTNGKSGWLCTSRSSLKRWLLNHQDILAKHQNKLDIVWLVDIISPRS